MQNSSEPTSAPIHSIREEPTSCNQQTVQMLEEEQQASSSPLAHPISEPEREKQLRAEQSRLLELNSAISALIISPLKQAELLQRCCEVMVHHLTVSLVCIWTCEEVEPTLQLQASAGDTLSIAEHEALHTFAVLLNDKIVVPQHPYITSTTHSQLAQSLSGRPAFSAFAGYPLIVEKQILGVLGIFAPHPLDAATSQTLATSASTIALALAHRRINQAYEQLQALSQKAQIEAEQALELRNAFLFSVTHDLKSPLTSIIGSSQLLARCIEKYQPPESAKYLQPLEVISASTRRMTTMIEDLLDLACLQMGLQLELKREESDMIEVARRLVQEHQQTTSKHQIILQTDLQALLADYDAMRIERVLANLLSNAIKYSPAGGDIHLTIARQQTEEGSWAVIALQDYGIGIPRQDLPYIFEPFHRASNSERTIQGTGLGLTSASQIIEQHGGSIGVTSEEGQGTTFTIRLPLSANPAKT